MGNPLGPCFSNYYMSHVENKVLEKVTKAKRYVRYVDDIFKIFDEDKKKLII